MLATTASSISYQGNGSTTGFTWPYDVILSDDIKVYLVDSENVETLQTSGVTVALVGSATNGIYSGATITFSSAPSSSYVVKIVRDPELTQEFDFDSEQDPLPVITRHADLTEMKLQSLSRRIDDSISASTSNYVSATDGNGTALSLADWFAGMSRGATPPASSYGYFSDRATNGDYANPVRVRDRLFVGDGADEDGTTTPSGTWLSSLLNAYLTRGTQLLSISPSGGTAGTFATRRSDVYDGNAVWTSGEAVTAGAKRGYINSNGAQTLYTAQNSGTTGATPPTHTTGTVSDGTVSWTFTQLQYRTGLALSFVALNDALDGGTVTGMYGEVVRSSGAGGMTIGFELDAKNLGSDVGNNPYAMDPSGGTVGLWLGGGGDSTYGGAPANPSMAAINVVRNSHTWNKGLVFGATSLTDIGGGIYIPIALFEGCYIRQYVSDGSNGGQISFNVTAGNERTRLNFANRSIQFLCQSALMGAFSSAPSAGTAPDEYLDLIAQAAGTGYSSIQPRGTASDVGLRLLTKGTGVITTGATVQPTADATYALGDPSAQYTNAYVSSNVFIGGKAGWKTIAASAVQVSRNSVNGAGDATETTAATITIPAGTVGANGIIKVTFLGTCTNSANVKTWRIRLGGLSGTAFYSLAATNQAATQVQLLIRNRNSASSQIGYSNQVAAAFGQTTASPIPAAINTANAQDIVITTAWAGATSGETMSVEAYQVEVFYQA